MALRWYYPATQKPNASKRRMLLTPVTTQGKVVEIVHHLAKPLNNRWCEVAERKTGQRSAFPPRCLIYSWSVLLFTLVPERKHRDDRSGESAGSDAHPGGRCKGGGRGANVTARNTSLVGWCSVSHTTRLRLTLSGILFKLCAISVLFFIYFLFFVSPTFSKRLDIPQRPLKFNLLTAPVLPEGVILVYHGKI